MLELRSEISISATVAETWRVFAAFSEYPGWNPFITSLSGDFRVGGRLSVILQQPGSRPLLMRPRLLVLEPERELRWLGRLGVPGLFDGEHSFTLARNEDGTTSFVQSESFRGILVPLFARMLDSSTRRGFELMNAALKKRVEEVKT